MNKVERKVSVTELPSHLAEGRFARFDADDPVIRDIVSVQAGMRSRLHKIKHVHELRMSNLLEAPLANLRASKAHAEKRLIEGLPLVDGQRKKTNAEIARLEKEIDSSLHEGAVKWQFARETRQHVKSLSKEDRSKFIEGALSNADKRAAAAVLGVPGYLAGLNESARELFLSRYKKACFPDQTARIKALSEAQRILDAGGSALMSEVEVLYRNADLSSAEAHADRLRQAETSE